MMKNDTIILHDFNFLNQPNDDGRAYIVLPNSVLAGPPQT